MQAIDVACKFRDFGRESSKNFQHTILLGIFSTDYGAMRQANPSYFHFGLAYSIVLQLLNRKIIILRTGKGKVLEAM